jgi:hypothetical protein
VVASGLVFVAAGAVLVLEILSVRLLAPYVGLTLETTTSIIGAVLATIALALLTVGQHSPCNAETTYHCAQIEVDPERPTAELLLLLDRGYNSEIDLNDPSYLGFS